MLWNTMGFVLIALMNFAPANAQLLQFPDLHQIGFYVGGEGGWTNLEDEINRIPDKKGPESWRDGFNVGLRVGYEWEAFRLEGEFRYQDNDAKSIGRHPAKGDRAAYPLLVNAIYDIHLGWPVSPHFGAGIGVVGLHDRISVPVIGVGQATDQTDWEFGYQAIAGLRYDISPALAVDLDYRYLGTTTARFTTRPGLVIDGTPVGNLQATSRYRSHNLVASLSFRFGVPP
jgi:opacity protein-like surface antigen